MQSNTLQSFKCGSCGAPVEFNHFQLSTKCAYCGTYLMQPPVLRQGIYDSSGIPYFMQNAPCSFSHYYTSIETCLANEPRFIEKT